MVLKNFGAMRWLLILNHKELFAVSEYCKAKILKTREAKTNAG